jgi:transcriptional regulator
VWVPGPGASAIRSLFDNQLEPGYSICMSNEERPKADILQGTLDLMVLQALNALGPQHGYAIAARLEKVSRGAIQLNMGTLYPCLIRLEQRGHLKGEWGVTDSNRKARFYKISAAGKRQLTSGKQDWDRTVSLMAELFGETS